MSNSVDVPLLATSYRGLVLSFGFQLLGGLMYSLVDSELLGPLVIGGVSATLAAVPYFAHRTAIAIGSPAPALWAFLMAIPCLNLFAMLSLSSEANSACRKHGIPVGLLGPEIPS